MKYRGKQIIDDHYWYYGDLIYVNRAAYIIEQSDKGEYHSIKVVPVTVERCIDYVDVNGVDIYEGDIIKIRGFDARWSEQNEEFYEVETRNGFLSKLTECKRSIIEVVGNKWDNPHVLKMCKKETRNDSNDSSRTGETEEVAS